MAQPTTLSFFAGAITFGYLTASLFFIKFWRRSADRFFLLFALSFAVLGLERILLEFSKVTAETRGYYYLLRLAAFTIIVIAIVDKNRQPRSGPG